MDFVFLMMKGAAILAVDIVDIEEHEETVAQAAAKIAAEIESETGTAPTAYAVLGCTDDTVWLLQQTTKLRRPAGEVSE